MGNNKHSLAVLFLMGMALLSFTVSCAAAQATAGRPQANSGQIEPQAGTWKTWALSSGNQFRPGPPTAFDSAQMVAELDEVKNFKRTFDTNRAAFRWAPTSAVLWPPLANKKIFG